MEKLNDDELQELLFKAFDSPAAEGLPLSFASNVRRKIQEQLNRKSDIRFNILVLCIFMLSLVMGYGLLYVIHQTTADLVLTMVLKFKWLLLSAICLFFLFLGIDQRLVKRDY